MFGIKGFDTLQLIPLLALTAYFVYLSYYYAAPMFRLKVMLFYAHLRYRPCEIRFVGGRITFRRVLDGEELLVERPVEVDIASRFLAFTTCREFRLLLRDLRKGTIPELNSDMKGEDGFGLSTGERPGQPGRQGAEKNRD